MFLSCPDTPQFQNCIAGSINHLPSNVQQRWSLFWDKLGPYEKQILGKPFWIAKVLLPLPRWASYFAEWCKNTFLGWRVPSLHGNNQHMEKLQFRPSMSFGIIILYLQNKHRKLIIGRRNNHFFKQGISLALDYISCVLLNSFISNKSILINPSRVSETFLAAPVFAH